MFSFSRKSQIGNTFIDEVYQYGALIGNIVNDDLGIFLNLHNEISLKSMTLLFSEVSNIYPQFNNQPFGVLPTAKKMH